MSLKIQDYHYNLPESLIADKPCDQRDHCRLLTLNKNTREINHLHFYHILELLTPNDVLVLNQSKVFPARLFGKKDSGGDIEVLLIRQIKDDIWLAISKPRPHTGQQIVFDHNLIGQIIQSDPQTGQIQIRFNYKNNQFFQILDKIGHTPIPPYIHSSQTEPQIRSEYQTVYAKETGSAAAPTAGLHFTKKLLSQLKTKGIQIEYVTLHVGLGTFQSLRPENLQKKTLHSEFYEIATGTAKRLNLAKATGKRIIAIGTTSVRTLESASVKSKNIYQIIPGKNHTEIFIYPPYKFKFVDALITNFHLPESSLLMLVSAFAGKKNIFTVYQQAIDRKYRFFSFGDAMFIY